MPARRDRDVSPKGDGPMIDPSPASGTFCQGRAWQAAEDVTHPAVFNHQIG